MRPARARRTRRCRPGGQAVAATPIARAEPKSTSIGRPSRSTRSRSSRPGAPARAGAARRPRAAAGPEQRGLRGRQRAVLVELVGQRQAVGVLEQHVRRARPAPSASNRGSAGWTGGRRARPPRGRATAAARGWRTWCGRAVFSTAGCHSRGDQTSQVSQRRADAEPLDRAQVAVDRVGGETPPGRQVRTGRPSSSSIPMRLHAGPPRLGGVGAAGPPGSRRRRPGGSRAVQLAANGCALRLRERLRERLRDRGRDRGAWSA